MVYQSNNNSNTNGERSFNNKDRKNNFKSKYQNFNNLNFNKSLSQKKTDINSEYSQVPKNKLYTGKITILRIKNNLGIIALDDGTKSLPINFPDVFEDGDRVEVSFKDDSKSQIEYIKSLDDTTYYGVISSTNVEKHIGNILCFYPKIKGTIFFFNNKNYEVKTKVKFNIVKKNDKKQAQNIEPVEEKEFYKTIPPGIIIYQGQSFYTYKRRLKPTDYKNTKYKNDDFEIVKVPLHNNNICKFVNFTKLTHNDIYYIYQIHLRKEYHIYKLDLLNINEILSCYRNADDEIKLRLIDRLIEADLKIKNYDKETLKKQKIELLNKKLSSLFNDSNSNEKNLHYYLLELLKLDYNPSLISNLKKNKTIKLDLTNYQLKNYRELRTLYKLNIKETTQLLGNNQLNNIWKFVKEQKTIENIYKVNVNYKFILPQNTDIKKYQETKNIWKIIK